jgi:hypothetical protein
VFARDQWTPQQAWDWYDNEPWLIGANWVPSYAATAVEIWQADAGTPGANTFDLGRIGAELDMAQGAGMNTLRTTLSYEVWRADRDGFMSRLEQVLAAADQRGIRLTLIFWDDVNFTHGTANYGEPVLGVQPDPIPGVHNSRWTGTGGEAVRANPGNWELPRTDPADGSGARDYVTDVVGTYASDTRVLMWNIYNEPGNDGADVNESIVLLNASADWARGQDPIQPISFDVWGGAAAAARAQSDVISYHEYPGTANVSEMDGRPVIVTEWMIRRDSDPDPISRLLPAYYAKKIGIYNWGLAVGDQQTQYTWETPGDDSPWFTNLFHYDGTPYRQSEIDLFLQLTSGNPPPSATLSFSTSAPVVDGADIALLPSGTTTTNPNDSSTAVWFDQPHQGQTFTTGADPAGYELSAVSLLHNYGPSGYTWTATGPWDVIIGTIDGSNNLIPIASETIPQGTTAGFTSSDGVGDWLTFTLATPVVLSANTAYAFAVGINGGGAGAVFVRSDNDNDYTGGAAFSDSAAGNGFNNPTVSRSFDRIFHIDLHLRVPSDPFDDWATGGETFDGDANGDGVADGLAFLLGAATPSTDATGLVPTPTEDGSGGLVMSFDMLDSASRGTATLRVEHSNDLGTDDPWATVAVPDVSGGPTSGVTFVVSGSGKLDVTATIGSAEADGSGKLFGRLKATRP